MKPETDYFAHLARSMTALLNEIVRESAYALFRRSPEVVNGGPIAQGASPDFHLYITGRSIADADKGTFNVPFPPDRFLVYRVPTKISVSFLLQAKGLPSALTVKAYDKLFAYFFDTKSLTPFLPAWVQSKVGLYDRLVGSRAELRLRADDYRTDAPGEFNFQFDYLALYHSGNPLREEVRTKQRIIEYGNDSNERSVL